jgi:hypothetical protein
VTTAAAAPPARSDLPVDCGQLVTRDELPALFGLPVGSIVVRTVLGLPAPSVGRLQRVDCIYALTGPDAHGQPGPVLRMTVGLYRDRSAARDQHERNVADQRAGAVGTAQPALGDAAATVVQRDVEDVLLISLGVHTLDLDLPRGPVPLAPVDLLIDLARRVLPRLGVGESSAALPAAP